MDIFKKWLSKIKMDNSEAPAPAFAFVLADEETRAKIIEFVKPSHLEPISYLNLNIAFGVRDNENKIFLTRSRVESLGMNSAGTGLVTVHTYTVITKNGVFNALCTESPGDVAYDIPEGWETIVKPAIEHFSDLENWKTFEKRLAENEPGFSLLRYRGKCSSEMIEKLKEKYGRENPNLDGDSLKKTCEINSGEDARQLFIEHGCVPDRITNNYNKATVENYKKYATTENQRLWAKEEYRRILTEVAGGNVDDYENKLDKAQFICYYWISDDPCAELFTAAWRTVFEKAEVVPKAVGCIKGYISKFFSRFVTHAVTLEPLLDMTDSYLKTHFAQEYEKPSTPNSIIGSYKHESIRMRGIIAERRGVENTQGFEFVLTDEKALERMVSVFAEEYGNPKEIKEEVLDDFNFSYGVKDSSGKIFITGMTYGANDVQYNDSLHLIRFAAMLGDEQTVLMLDCRRDNNNGSIVLMRPYPYPGWFDQYREILTQMIAFYRSVPDRDNFEKSVKKTNPGFDIHRLIHDAPASIYEKYKEAFEYDEEAEQQEHD